MLNLQKYFEQNWKFGRCVSLKMDRQIDFVHLTITFEIILLAATIFILKRLKQLTKILASELTKTLVSELTKTLVSEAIN